MYCTHALSGGRTSQPRTPTIMTSFNPCPQQFVCIVTHEYDRKGAQLNYCFIYDSLIGTAKSGLRAEQSRAEQIDDRDIDKLSTGILCRAACNNDTTCEQ